MKGSQIKTDETKLYSVPGNAMGRTQLDIFLFYIWNYFQISIFIFSALVFFVVGFCYVFIKRELIIFKVSYISEQSHNTLFLWDKKETRFARKNL